MKEEDITADTEIEMIIKEIDIHQEREIIIIGNLIDTEVNQDLDQEKDIGIGIMEEEKIIKGIDQQIEIEIGPQRERDKGDR